MVDGDKGMKVWVCLNRKELFLLNDIIKLFILVNYFRIILFKEFFCVDNLVNFMEKFYMCYDVVGNRWVNFVVVDYYKV